MEPLLAAGGVSMALEEFRTPPPNEMHLSSWQTIEVAFEDVSTYH